MADLASPGPSFQEFGPDIRLRLCSLLVGMGDAEGFSDGASWSAAFLDSHFTAYGAVFLPVRVAI